MGLTEEEEEEGEIRACQWKEGGEREGEELTNKWRRQTDPFHVNQCSHLKQTSRHLYRLIVSKEEKCAARGLKASNV